MGRRLACFAEGVLGKRSIPEDAVPPFDPEAIRGAKGWLARVMARPYSEVADQPARAAQFDLDQARQRSPSFAKLWRDFRRLLQELAD